MSESLIQALDWGKLVPLRMRARTVADGVYAGTHRSARRGAGIEFGGHRAYVPGDDLRWLDRHALMRHGQLLVRQFETETDRALCLVIDASASMAFRSERAPAAKLAYAALIGAALARIALGGSDPVGLSWVGGERGQSLPATSGRATFDRVVGCLERIRPGGDLRLDAEALERSLAPVARQAGRGSIIVLLSDLLDLPEGAVERVTALSTHQRTVLVVRVLDPVEASFPFDGPVRLRALEGNALVETNAETARADYLRALRRIATEWNERLLARGGRVIETVTTDDPVQVVRDILLSAEGKAR